MGKKGVKGTAAKAAKRSSAASPHFSSKKKKFTLRENSVLASLFGPIVVHGDRQSRVIQRLADSVQAKSKKKKKSKSSGTSGEEELILPPLTKILRTDCAWLNHLSDRCPTIPTYEQMCEVDPSHGNGGMKRPMPGGGRPGRLPTTHFSPQFLVSLDRELEAFAQYVRLSPEEVAARSRLVDQIAMTAKNIFDGSTRWPDATDVELRVFGSFSTLAVCNYTSDVDLALFGVILPNRSTSTARHPEDSDDQKPPAKKRARPATATAALADADKETKRARLQKWSEALSALDQDSVATGLVSSTITGLNTKGNGVHHADDKNELFVIDRMGDSEEHFQPETTGCEHSKASDDRSDEDSADKLATYNAKATATGQVLDAHLRPGVLISTTTSGSSADNDDDYVDQDDDESSDDSCDDDDLDEEEGEMELVLVSKGGAPGVVHSAQSRRHREKVITALQALSNKIRKSSFSKSSMVIKARVPIIKITTKFGFEVDIAIGGDGTDTSKYAGSQVARYYSFATVTLFLKTLLAQQGLDVPFEGGLGSYKLYILLAHHIREHLALGGSDRPGEILLSFFFRFGFVKEHGVIEAARTKLDQEVALCVDDGLPADLSNVFKLSQCVRLFERCWAILSNCPGRAKNSSKPPAFLATLVDADQLRLDREARRRTAVVGAVDDAASLMRPTHNHVSHARTKSSEKSTFQRRAAADGTKRPHGRHMSIVTNGRPRQGGIHGNLKWRANKKKIF